MNSLSSLNIESSTSISREKEKGGPLSVNPKSLAPSSKNNKIFQTHPEPIQAESGYSSQIKEENYLGKKEGRDKKRQKSQIKKKKISKLKKLVF